jgi:hypothetical protein
VDLGLRRCTRGLSAKEGYRVPRITRIVPKPRKKGRKVVPATRSDQSREKNDDDDAPITPRIPIKTLQRIGQLLKIDPQLMTSNKLTSVLAEEASTSG